MRIGVFDSGVGGLTVLSRLIHALPNAEFDYLGDTARVPYGSRANETIIEYTHECLTYLTARGADLLVIACNTASAVALPTLRGAFGTPLVGVVEDGIAVAVEAATKRVLIIGTRATIGSRVYERGIRAANPVLEVRGMACPLFVPVVEEGWADTPVGASIARTYLQTCDDFAYDLLLLGCTHFPIMDKTLRAVVGKGVRIEEPATRLAARLASAYPQAATAGQPIIRFHVTDSPESFRRVAAAMGFHVADNVEHVGLTRLLAAREKLAAAVPPASAGCA